MVMQGVDALNLQGADQIVALGGGSVIDAAKLMKLKYASPSADLDELAALFYIRKGGGADQHPAEVISPVDCHPHDEWNGE